MVRADMIGLRLTVGEIKRGRLVEYIAQSTDRIDPKWQTVRRNGREFGTLIETKVGSPFIRLFDKFVEPAGTAFLSADASKTDAALPESYRVRIDGQPAQITEVCRKSKIVDTAMTGRFERKFVMQHDIVLSLNSNVGASVEIDFGPSELAPHDFEADTSRLGSEAIHVSHLGFEPQGSFKTGYLSFWRGQCQGDATVDYTGYSVFHLKDADTQETVFVGDIVLDKPVDEPSNDEVNFNGTNVYKLDFSSFREPGRYYLQIDGIGRSHPFPIRRGVWIEAFKHAMAGLYHQRSGIELTGSWPRPRNLHPADELIVRHSRATLLDTSMGLNLRNQNSFDALVEQATDRTAFDAWGGWQDAGDFDRRIQHLRAVRDLLELAIEFPAFAKSQTLAIPERSDRIPDLIDEALWGLDVFARLQADDGGVPGGIEADGHPRFGRPSWLTDQAYFVYAPDPWSSYEFAATSARAAFALNSYDRERATTYSSRALRAMQWAEANLSTALAANPNVNYARNLAALELYRLTGQAQWHELFLTTTSYDGRRIGWRDRQFESVVVYSQCARLGLSVRQQTLQYGQSDLLGYANFLLEETEAGAFGQIVNPHTPIGYAYTSAVPADASFALVKAYLITQERKFIKAIVGDTQFGLGANPDNQTFTTGLGQRSVPTALHVDGLILGRIPDGLTLFGNWNVRDRGLPGNLANLRDYAYPALSAHVPVHETFHGDIRAVPITEFSIHATLGPTAYVWGFLAAVKEQSSP